MQRPNVPGRGHSRQTKLVQRTISNLNDANGEFMDNGPDDSEVCIVAVHHPNACCWSVLLQVPSGPNVLWQNWGANQGKLDPGPKWCWPVWKQVSALVSKQVVTYNALPKQCPTRDMVFVDVNLSINFRIGPDVQRVQDFVFYMGAERLDGYLYFQVEESIRTLVQGVTYDKVNDLRSEFSGEMLRTLQSKVGPFGVDILNVKITDVALPRELQERLEKTTAFRTRLEEEEKTHNFAMQQIKNTHLQKMAEIKQSVNIESQRINAEATRYEIEMDEKMSVAESDRKVQTENANADMVVKITKCNGDVKVAQYQGRENADRLVQTSSILAEKDLRAATLEAATATREAQAKGQSAKHLAQALETRAKAEGEAAVNLEEKRRFEQRLRLGALDAEFASRGRKVLSGHAGESVMRSFVMARDELSDNATRSA